MEFLDQFYERHTDKADVADLICMSCRHMKKCDDKTKKNAYDNGNQCLSSCF